MGIPCVGNFEFRGLIEMSWPVAIIFLIFYILGILLFFASIRLIVALVTLVVVVLAELLALVYPALKELVGRGIWADILFQIIIY